MLIQMSDESGKRIRCGVAGVGYLGQHHARIYHEMESCELVGVYDTDAKRAREIADRYGCAVFGSLEELGAACEGVSVVVPTDVHCAVAIPLMEAGCHVLIEKPLCYTLAEAEKILAVAKEYDRLVQVGHIEHFNPVMGYLEGEVDRPRYITADRLAPFQPRGTEVGVVLDLMIHDIGVILQLVKAPVDRVESVGVNVLSSTEDIANARIRFTDGCVANLNASRVSLKKLREIRIFQPSAYLSLDFKNQAGHLIKKVGTELQKKEIPLEKEEPLKLELSAFLQSMTGSGQPKVGGALGKSALELAITITEQIRSATVSESTPDPGEASRRD